MPSGREQLKKLIDDLGKIPPDLKRELRPAIKRGAEPVLDQMRQNASWSTRIPPALRVSTSLSGSNTGVRIIADHHKAPHARVYEHGGHPGTFRAPLFGNRERWYSHRARPFFFRAVTERGDEVRQAIAEAIDTTVRKHGF